MDDILKNIDFSRKNKVFFNTKSPYVPSFSWFPPYVSSISKRFFSSIVQVIFRFLQKKLKMTLCNYVQKTIHFLKNSHIAYVLKKNKGKSMNLPFMSDFGKSCFFSKNTKNLNIGRIMKNSFMTWNIAKWRFSNLQFKEKKRFFCFITIFLDGKNRWKKHVWPV